MEKPGHLSNEILKKFVAMATELDCIQVVTQNNIHFCSRDRLWWITELSTFTDLLSLLVGDLKLVNQNGVLLWLRQSRPASRSLRGRWLQDVLTNRLRWQNNWSFCSCEKNEWSGVACQWSIRLQRLFTFYWLALNSRGGMREISMYLAISRPKFLSRR